MLLIAVVILIAVGPKRLPQLMKTVGQGVREIRRASNELRRTVGIDEMMRETDEVRRAVREPYKRPEPRALTTGEQDHEAPLEGVDVAEARHRAEVGMPVARERTTPAAATGADERAEEA